MELRQSLFATRRRTVAVAAVAVVVLVVAAVAAGVFGVPAVTGVDNRFAAVNDSTTTVATNLTVENPNPVGVTLGGVTLNYTVHMNDVRLASGEKRGVSVPAGTSTQSLTTDVDNGRIPAWWVSHLRNGEHTSVRIDARVNSGLLGTVRTPPITRSVDTDLLGSFNSSERRPVNANAPVVSDPVAYVERTNATWGQVTDAETPIQATFAVRNPKSYPIVVTRLGYTATMNDVRMANGSTERGYTIPPGETREIRARIALDNDKLDEWWVTHLENDQTTDLRIDFAARIDLRATTVEVPLRGVTYERTIRTDIFGNANRTADAGGSGGETTTRRRRGGTSTTTTDSLLGGDSSTTTTTADETTTEQSTTATTTTDATTTTADQTTTTTTTTSGGGLLG